MTLSLMAAGGVDVEHRLVLVLMQLSVIILIARVFAVLFRKWGQPAVVGEIVAGLVLGPSVLGKLESAGWLPNVSAMIFDPSVSPVLQILAQIGLVLLLFLIGLEFDFRHLRAHGMAAATISLAGVVMPFALAVAVGTIIHPHVAANVDRTSFLLFLGTALSITALPILGRMMTEMRISRTRTGALTITAAAIDDATGWILLAAVSALATAHYHLRDTLVMVASTLGFAAIMFLVVRPIVSRWGAWMLRRNNGELGLNGFAILLAILFVSAIATSKIGIFAIFGSFILGAVLSDQTEFRDAVHRLTGSFVTVFFLPIFFTYTGLRTDIGSLNTPLLWLFALMVIAAAVLGKLGGCTIAARVGKMPWRESLCIGVMMNTRALMELIVVNVGYDLGVIPRSVFCMLVMMAVLTTVMTTPLLTRCMRGTELEAGMRSSGFGGAG
ncbi:MAG: cation:proton antiporter [Tepidisphaeraceae bacterium]